GVLVFFTVSPFERDRSSELGALLLSVPAQLWNETVAPLREIDPLHEEPQAEPQLRGEGGQHEPGEQNPSSVCRGQHLRQAEEDIAPTPDDQQDAEGPGQVPRSVDQMTEQDAAEAEEQQAGTVAQTMHAE